MNLAHSDSWPAIAYRNMLQLFMRNIWRAVSISYTKHKYTMNKCKNRIVVNLYLGLKGYARSPVR
jgi:hypothetical protein